MKWTKISSLADEISSVFFERCDFEPPQIYKLDPLYLKFVSDRSETVVFDSALKSSSLIIITPLFFIGGVNFQAGDGKGRGEEKNRGPTTSEKRREKGRGEQRGKETERHS
jgi:hypothetical protein